ncbi:MAG: c-type cytochrome [Gemmatimonadales bacterium]|nr:c-type cytochrome [Gemmatimonadales bacterium]NIN11038.1 c-type cytochrome [Gemmatimonadales bacterium]NIN49635.1 c-type cytochrome [Gemmatimonadales bacterium]NIP07099.1 c-type cytochrome [Gemmatimonadales bacterium]NIQ99490.1 c-type cytochrome [Gemmatimonadales bacterium]
MQLVHRSVALAVGTAVLWVAAAQAQQASDSVPPGATKEMVAQGASLFAGQGLCMVCHGQDAKGLPNLGADLTDDEWLHSDGSYDGILQSIMEGVSGDKSSTGTVMPPKGGSSLSEAQLKAVAAYVWSLSRKQQ